MPAIDVRGAHLRYDIARKHGSRVALMLDRDAAPPVMAAPT
jgi:hypothetical protein